MRRSLPLVACLSLFSSTPALAEGDACEAVVVVIIQQRALLESHVQKSPRNVDLGHMQALLADSLAPTDPWRRPWVIRLTSAGPVVSSAGENGVPGDSDDIGESSRSDACPYDAASISTEGDWRPNKRSPTPTALSVAGLPVTWIVVAGLVAIVGVAIALMDQMLVPPKK